MNHNYVHYTNSVLVLHPSTPSCWSLHTYK